jgi:hypothetical protein
MASKEEDDELLEELKEALKSKPDPAVLKDIKKSGKDAWGKRN